MNITLNNEKWYSYCDPQYEYVIQSLTSITCERYMKIPSARRSYWVVLPIIPVQSTRTALVENQKQFVSFLTVVTALNPQNEGFPPLWWARAHPTLPVIGWCSKPEKSQPLKATSAGQSSIGEVKIINCQKRAYPQWYVGPSSGSEPGSRPKPRPRPRLVTYVFDHWKLITIHQNICRIKHIIHGNYSCTTV